MAWFFASCTEERIDPGSLAVSGPNVVGETTYVRLNPEWVGFNKPRDIVVGNEPFLYVADTDNDRIIMLDQAGRVLGISLTIKRPIAIAQDKRLQLLVCAEFDTLLPGRSVPTTFGAVFRLDLVSVGHLISLATPQRVYYDDEDSTRRYTGVATLYDNSYYVTRVGPKNEQSVVDKDNSILLFSKSDVLITPVTQTFSHDGTGLLSIHRPTGIATLPNSRSVEYVFSQIEVSAATVPLYKVQWIRLVTEGQTTNYVSKFYPSVNGDIGMLEIEKFTRPEGVALDPSGNLFVVDAAKDSLYIFNTRGVEQFSFGGTGSGEKQFSEPSGVSFYDKTVYVADAGNNRVVRFKLSTDLR